MGQYVYARVQCDFKARSSPSAVLLARDDSRKAIASTSNRESIWPTVFIAFPFPYTCARPDLFQTVVAKRTRTARANLF
jgi:hypothetical protein